MNSQLCVLFLLMLACTALAIGGSFVVGPKTVVDKATVSPLALSEGQDTTGLLAMIWDRVTTVSEPDALYKRFNLNDVFSLKATSDHLNIRCRSALDSLGRSALPELGSYHSITGVIGEQPALDSLARVYSMKSCIKGATTPPQSDFFVATNGSDDWSGTLSSPNRARTDGPFATLTRARDAVRILKVSQPPRKTSILVLVRGGFYYQNTPLTFGPMDSGISSAPIIYQAYPGEHPVVSGGLRLSNWTVDAQGRWHTNVPGAANRSWWFAQLFVNGERRCRPRLPEKGYFRVEEVCPSTPDLTDPLDRNCFRFRPSDMHNWASLADVEFLLMNTYVVTRRWLASVAESEAIARLTTPLHGNDAYWSITKGGRYLVENVREALDSPGEWYLDRVSGELTYIPMPGENVHTAVVIAPKLDSVIRLAGDTTTPSWVRYINFIDLTIAHTGWTLPTMGWAGDQSESAQKGAIHAEGAQYCTIQRCDITNVAGYAVDLRYRCKYNQILDCNMTDLGAGGVKIERSPTDTPDASIYVSSRNTVRGNIIAHGGRLHPCGNGVVVGHSSYNTIDRNDIFDFYHNGISLGWFYGNGAHHNLVTSNHIRSIGQGVLSDIGGIYTLGCQPGTVLRFNKIHDIGRYSYGGWGIYLDEWSSGILAEKNLVYRTAQGGFNHNHGGTANTISNNIFAADAEWGINRNTADDAVQFSFQRNIVYLNRASLLGGNWKGNGYALDYNLYWNSTGDVIKPYALTFTQWQIKGQDTHSLIADPLFADPNKGDFTLKTGSPVSQIGFLAFDVSAAGSGRMAGTQSNKPRAFPESDYTVKEGFETIPVGGKAPYPDAASEADRANVFVTNAIAASGSRSLKLSGVAGQKYIWSEFTSGVTKLSFDVHIEPGSVFVHEWRQWRQDVNPYLVGPSIRLKSDGTVVANGRMLGKVSQNQWVRFEVEAGLGYMATGNYALVVTLAGNRNPSLFSNITFDNRFSILHQAVFSAEATQSGAIHLDNIHVLGGESSVGEELTPR